MLIYKDKGVSVQTAKPIATYREQKHGRTLYRITNVHKGKMDFTKAIEGLIIKKILIQENSNLAIQE